MKAKKAPRRRDRDARSTQAPLGGRLPLRALLLLGLLPGCKETAGVREVQEDPVDPVPEEVVLTPATASVEAGDTVPFKVVVRAGDGNEIQAPVSFAAKGGTISDQGLYVAGDAAGVYSVTATLVGAALADSSVVTVTTTGARTYTTAFPLDEDPISEGDAWITGGRVGLDWTDVATKGGRATGKQVGASYTDATAIVGGQWAADQMATATVHAGSTPAENCYPEVELRLRSTISSHANKGYEVAFKVSRSSSAYLIIVRWNGPLGDFTYLTRLDGAQYGVKDGDVVSARVVGDAIVAFKNGVAVGHAVDTTYTLGSPGMGFNLENGPAGCSGTNRSYGFTSFTATEVR